MVFIFQCLPGKLAADEEHISQLTIIIDGTKLPDKFKAVLGDVQVVLETASGEFRYLSMYGYQPKGSKEDQTEEFTGEITRSVQLESDEKWIGWARNGDQLQIFPVDDENFALYRLREDVKPGGGDKIVFSFLSQEGVLEMSKEEILNRIRKLDSQSSLVELDEAMEAFVRFVSDKAKDRGEFDIDAYRLRSLKEIWDVLNEEILSSGEMRSRFVSDTSLFQFWTMTSDHLVDAIAHKNWKSEQNKRREERISIFAHMLATGLKTVRKSHRKMSKSWPDIHLGLVIQQCRDKDMRSFLEAFSSYLQDRKADSWKLAIEGVCGEEPDNKQGSDAKDSRFESAASFARGLALQDVGAIDLNSVEAALTPLKRLD